MSFLLICSICLFLAVNFVALVLSKKRVIKRKNPLAKEYIRKDRFYHKAKAEGYRGRAAYKLIELQNRFSLIRPGARVLDLGSFPGGWLQVALDLVGKKGKLVGVDLKAVEAVRMGENEARIILGDFTEPDIAAQLMEESARFHCIISDLSPAITGIKMGDAFRSAELVSAAMSLFPTMLMRGGNFVAKIFPGPEAEELAKELKKQFETFQRCQLESTRQSSKELYFVCRKYKAPSMKQA
ncbi:UNVERIFIED_CONTAM: hypothetical protein GTU68_057707 [Idotea baltica]|nr:hypothetical protein [Idotea baltica]